MAQIHNTTMSPTKLELLDRWLPQQPWYAGTGRPDLNRAGGFRLDDPDGEVGIEFMFVRDGASDDGTTYQVPMTYRGAPLEDVPEAALIGTSEHGVLGKRFVYDGVHDPVLVAQLLALFQGAAVAQHQSKSDTTEPRVRVGATTAAEPTESETIAAPDGTVVRLARILTAGSAPDDATLLASFDAPTGHCALTMSG